MNKDTQPIHTLDEGLKNILIKESAREIFYTHNNKYPDPEVYVEDRILRGFEKDIAHILPFIYEKLLKEWQAKQRVEQAADEYIYTLSPYQIGYLKSLFYHCDAPEPHNINVQFIGMQPTGNLHIGYIKYGVAQRELIKREPEAALKQK